MWNVLRASVWVRAGATWLHRLCRARSGANAHAHPMFGVKSCIIMLHGGIGRVMISRGGGTTLSLTHSVSITIIHSVSKTILIFWDCINDSLSIVITHVFTFSLVVTPVSTLSVSVTISTHARFLSHTLCTSADLSH